MRVFLFRHTRVAMAKLLGYLLARLAYSPKTPQKVGVWCGLASSLGTKLLIYKILGWRSLGDSNPCFRRERTITLLLGFPLH